MSPQSFFLSILAQKLQWIKDQTKELHKVADNLCDKVVEETTEVLKNSNVNKNELQEINFRLDEFFAFLSETTRHLDDAVQDNDYLEKRKLVTEAAEPYGSFLKMIKRHSETDTLKNVNRLEVLEEAVSSMRSSQQHLLILNSEFDEKLTTKFHDIDNQSQKFQERIKNCEETEKNIFANLTTLECIPDALKIIQNKTEKMAVNMQQQEAKLFPLLQLSLAVEKNKTLIADLVLKSERMDSALSELSKIQVKEKERLLSAENKMTAVSTLVSITNTEFYQKFQAITDQYELIKQVLLKKVENLERLREILNSKCQAKTSKKAVMDTSNDGEDFQCKKDPTLISELNIVRQHLLDLENRYTFTPVGFTAFIRGKVAVKKGDLLNRFFKNVRTNHGHHFDPVTCRFTAPLHGMYMIALTLWQRNKGKIGAQIQKTLHYPGLTDGTEKPEVVGKVWTESPDSSSCCVCLTHMREGDKIDVVIVAVDNNPSLATSTCLTCFLV